MSAGKVELGSGIERPAVIDRSAFAGMFDDHAAHLYDYCLSLLGDAAEAASAARVTLIASYKLGGRMTEPGRLRAWMFALGRRECLSESPTRKQPWAAAGRPRPAPGLNAGVPPTIAEAETREFARIDPAEPTRAGFEAEIRRVVRRAARPETIRPSRPDGYHEALDLVQRHGIAQAELPAILDIPAEEVQNLLAPAPGTLPQASRDKPEPLATMPAALWRHTAGVVFDSEQASLCDAIAADAARLWADGFPDDPVEVMPPSHKRMAVTSVGLAAALLAPAALGAGLYAAFAASPHSVTRSHVTVIAPPHGLQQPSTAGSASSAANPGNGVRTHQKGRQSITSIFPTEPTSAPVIVTTAKPKPKHTTPTTHRSSPPVIKSGPPSVTPSPSPTSPSPTPTSPAPTSPAPTSPAPSQSSLPTNEGTSSSPTSSTSPSNPPVVTPSPDPSPSPSPSG